MKKLLLIFIFLSAFLVATQVHAAVYYFNNAVNTDPTELGNYWNDSGVSDPALSLPDNTVDEISVVSGAVYDGDAIFNGSAVNEGEVTGDAIFNEDVSENYGVIGGSKIRKYRSDIVTSRDFVSDGPWEVIADGVEVTIIDATTDGTTLLSRLNGGVFIVLNRLFISAEGESITLTYDRDIAVDANVYPSDYTAYINGVITDVSSVDINGPRATLTFETDFHPGDEIILSYTPSGIGIGEGSFNNLQVQFQVAVGSDVPDGSIGINHTLYACGSHTVTVIDSTDLISTIPVGNGATCGNAFVGTTFYVINGNDGTISVVNTNTASVVDTINIGELLSGSIIVGTKLYVVKSISNGVVVIDTNDNTIIKTIPTSGVGYLHLVGKKLYMVSGSSVSVIDTTTDSLIETIPMTGPGFALVSIGTKLYVNNTVLDAVSVIDTVTDTILGLIAVGDSPEFSAVANGKVYVINAGGSGSEGTVTVIDPATDTVVESLTIGLQPYTASVKGTVLHVTNIASRTLSVIDSVNDTVLSTIPLGQNLSYYNTVINHLVYTSNTDSDNPAIFVLDTNKFPHLLPNLTSFSTSASSGTYSVGQSIPVTAHFGRTLSPGSTMTVLLNTGRSVTLNNVSGSTLSGTYVIQAGDTTPDLAVRSITSASVSDGTHTRTSYDLPSSVGSFDAENSFITRNLGDNKNIQIGSYQSFNTGTNPYQISAPINGFLYTANQGAGTVSVINATTGALTQTINVGSEPYGLVQRGTELYVVNTGSDTVSVIDTTSNTVTHTISVGVKPYYAATIGTNVYITNSMSNTVSVINTATHTVTATIPVGSYPRGIKAHGTDLYVANYGDPNYSGGNYISVINSLTNQVSDTIILPAGSDGPRGVATLGDKVYVTNFRSNNVSVIDTATNEITDTIPVGIGPRGIAGTGTTLYVENFDDGTLSIINTNTNTVTDTIDVGSSPAGIAISGTTAYLTAFQDNRIYTLDTTTNALIASAQVQEEPEPSSSGPSGGSVRAVSQTPIAPAPTQPTDCLPTYKFSPSTGKPCVASSTSYPASAVVSRLPSSASLPTQTLKHKSTGPLVTYLQHFLNSHGFPVAPSGVGSLNKETQYFGLATKASVIKFQKTNNLVADGIVGKGTWGKIYSMK